MSQESPKSRFANAAGLVVGLLTVVASGANVTAQTPRAWHTGAALQKQLDQAVGVTWSGVPLRGALARLAASQQAAIFLDRRVDPGQELSLRLEDVPLRLALEKIAASRGLGVSQLHSVSYIGPPSITNDLRTLSALARNQVEQLPREVRGAYLRPQPLRWEKLATPREILAQLAAEARIEVTNLERVPHDLWPEGDLPELALVDRLTLLLAGFQLTFTIAPDGKAVTIVPIPEPVRIVREYRGGTTARSVAAKLSEYVPGATIDVQGDRLIVTGRAEDHDIVDAGLKGQPLRRPAPPAQAPGQKVYTLTIANQPVGPLAVQLGRQLQLEVTFDDAAISAAGISLDTRVSFQVKDASLEELLTAMLKPVGLGYTQQDKQLQIKPINP